MNRESKEIWFMVWLVCIVLCLDNYMLKHEIKTLNMLVDFDSDIINNRTKLLDNNRIKYDNYIYIEKENK